MCYWYYGVKNILLLFLILGKQCPIYTNIGFYLKISKKIFDKKNIEQSSHGSDEKEIDFEIPWLIYRHTWIFYIWNRTWE